MRKIAPLFLVLFCAASLYAYPGNLPQGYANDPPQNRTCIVCHGGHPLNSGEGSISISGIEDYVPGQQYSLTLELSDPNQDRWAFQFIAKSGNNAMGTMVVTDAANTRIVNSYFQTTYSGQHNGTPNGTSWTIGWIAPDSDQGPVTFYFVGIACNGTGGTSGDYTYATSLTVEANVTPNEPPTAFDLTSPDNLASLDYTLLETPFSWQASTDPEEAGPIYYRIKVFTQPGADLVYSGMTNEPSFQLLTAAAYPTGDYIWNVMAYDVGGDSTASTSQWTFTYTNTPPAPFDLDEPEDNFTFAPNDPLTFSWDTSEDPDDEGACNYILRLYWDETEPTVYREWETTEVAQLVDDLNPPEGSELLWDVTAVDAVGNETVSTERRHLSLITSGLPATENGLPSSWTLSTPWPNPFNSSVTIQVEVPHLGFANLAVFNTLGQRIAQLHEGPLSAGSHQFSWRPRESSGIYILQLVTPEGASLYRKVSLIR